RLHFGVAFAPRITPNDPPQLLGRFVFVPSRSASCIDSFPLGKASLDRAGQAGGLQPRDAQKATLGIEDGELLLVRQGHVTSKPASVEKRLGSLGVGVELRQ